MCKGIGEIPDDSAASEEERSERTLQREGPTSQRHDPLSDEVSELAGHVQRKPKTLVALASTATSFDEYFQSCPADLKELGLFESQFEKWPESPLLQPTAIKTLIYRLPGHHHATRYRTGDLLRRLGGLWGHLFKKILPFWGHVLSTTVLALAGVLAAPPHIW